MTNQQIPAKERTGCVVANHGRRYVVLTDTGARIEASRRGKKGDVAVGDRVCISPPIGGVAAIDTILERHSLLFRSDAWRVKTLAANIDLLAVVLASRPSFNPRFVWQAMIAAKAAGVPCLVIRNKTDLEDPEGRAESFVTSLRNIGEDVVELSAKGSADAAKRLLDDRFCGKTVLLVGQSGMGKSTLLNLLCPEANAQTQEFSEALDLGKQTTTDTRLFEIRGTCGYRLIDSPGFQAFGLSHITRKQLIEAMPEIAAHARGCRFYNCAHTGEPGCSVKAALDAGLIAPERYNFYCDLAKIAQPDAY